MGSWKGSLLRLAFNIALGVGLILIWLHSTNLNDLISHLKLANLKLSLLFLPLAFLPAVLRSLRLKILLNDHRLKFVSLLELTLLSQLLSFLIPIRAGEITKGFYLANKTKNSVGQTLVWVLADRFLDFWANLLLLGLLLLIIPTQVSGIKVYLMISGLIFLTVFLILMIARKKMIQDLSLVFTRLLQVKWLKRAFLRLSETVLDGLRVLKKNPKELLVLFFLTTLALILEALLWQLTFVALGVNTNFLLICLGSLLSALTFLIPAAPGYVGSAQVSTLVVFSGILGLDKGLVSAAGVLYPVLVSVGMLISGLISLYLLKLNLRDILKEVLSTKTEQR